MEFKIQWKLWRNKYKMFNILEYKGQETRQAQEARS